jgi:predicted amidohydrolase
MASGVFLSDGCPLLRRLHADTEKRNSSMQKTLCAAVVQFNVTFGDVRANLAKALQAMERAARQGARLIVLPEMWSCGFDYRNLSEAAARTPQVLEAMARVSEALHLVVVGSLPEQAEDGLYNTSFVLDQGRGKGRYRKLHLFSPMREDRYLRAGDTTMVVETSLGRIGLAICYDLRFPELFRRLALDGADMVCLSAQWPSPRQEHWRILLRARAIENQLFLLAANGCGAQGKLDFFGMSLIVAPQGEVLAEGGDRDGEVLAELDPRALRDYRARIPAWRDRRPEIYGDLS